MARHEERNDRFTELEDQYAGYTVHDPHGEKIGKVDDLFVDEHDQPEYIGVKMGFLGLRSTLIPVDATTIDKERGFIEVSQPKSMVKEGPSFDDDSEITPEIEQQVLSYYGLEERHSSEHQRRGGYEAYYGDSHKEQPGEAGPGIRMGDRDQGGQFREHPPGQEGLHEQEDDLNDTDELRVQRTEEELRAGTRERQAGQVNVRKRVRTDREQIRVPKRHEEVHVERVPVEEGREASEAQIGEDEISVPVVEEEVVVEKRPVVKEEIRLRKDVAEQEEMVEEDVRREEVDIDDQTTREKRGK